MKPSPTLGILIWWLKPLLWPPIDGCRTILRLEFCAHQLILSMCCWSLIFMALAS
jgi:hypothetical protein